MSTSSKASISSGSNRSRQSLGEEKQSRDKEKGFPATQPVSEPSSNATISSTTSSEYTYTTDNQQQPGQENIRFPVSTKKLRIIREPDGRTGKKEQQSLQETLRGLNPEGGENDIYWLPVAVARLGFRNANIRTAGLNLQSGGEQDSEDKIDPTKAILSRWDQAAKIEEKLYELKEKELRKMKLAEYGMDSVDAQEVKSTIKETDDADEDLQELLDELRLSGPNVNFKRANERRSKRFTSAFEEEIAERNQHLRQRMEHMNSRVKRFEKGFETLDSLAVKMDQLAESSKLRVQFLEQCLVPLYNESARHQICRNNAEKALMAIDAALHHYQVPDQLTAVIQAGPVKNLPAYCAALERVKASVDFFAEFHTTSPEFEQVSQMYRTGRDNLIKEFRDLLRMHSKAVPSVMIYDAIMNNLRDPSISHDFAHFAETVYNDLKLVTQWFQATKDTFDFMDVYASFRLAAMRESLQQFRSFYKDALEAGTIGQGQGANEADFDRRSVNTSIGRDGSVRSGEDEDDRSIYTEELSMPGQGHGLFKSSTLRKRTHPAKSTPRKKATPGGHHGTMTAGLFQKLRRMKSTGLGSTKKSSGAARVGIDEDTYQNVEIYMTLISAFLKLIESEVGLMYGIIPDAHMREVFDKIVLPAIERFVILGRELAEKIFIHVQNGDFSAVLLLLQVLEHFEGLKPLFASALEGCTHDTQLYWSQVQQIFRTAVQRTMDGFLSSIKTTTDRVLPSADGTVHEITSNTIAFLSNLVDYRVLFDSIISPDAQGKTEKKTILGLSRPATALHVHNFPQYLNSVVTHLLASLTTRAENYNDQTLKSIFLLNNISYMFNYLKQAGIIDVMKEDNANVDSLIYSRIKEQRAAYADCWTPLTRLLTDAIGEAGQLKTRSPHDVSMQVTTTNYETQLKEKDRQVIKDRCSAINKELVQQSTRQEKYSVPDQTLRMNLQQNNRDTIISLYHTYRERYTRIPFTKFHDKYLPYTTSQVSDMLDRFFSQDTFSTALNTAGQSIRVDD